MAGRLNRSTADVSSDDSDDELLYDEENPDPHVHRVKRELDTVVDVMKNNIGKVVERGERLENIEERSENLLEGATAFRSGARRVQRKMWWQNIRLKVLISLVVLFVLLIIIGPILWKYL